jgi:hypothetical protein
MFTLKRKIAVLSETLTSTYYRVQVFKPRRCYFSHVGRILLSGAHILEVWKQH